MDIINRGGFVSSLPPGGNEMCKGADKVAEANPFLLTPPPRRQFAVCTPCRALNTTLTVMRQNSYYVTDDV